MKKLTPLFFLFSLLFFSSCCELTNDCEEKPPIDDEPVTTFFDLLPENGNPSLSSYTIHGRWQKDNLTYYIANTSPDLSSFAQENIFRMALDKWAAVTPLTFTQVNSPNDADIILGFGGGQHCHLYNTTGATCSPASQFDGPSQVLAHCYFPGQGNLSGDAHFDEDEFWAETIGFGGTSLLSVAIHELGHGLGLDHSTVINSMMYASYDQGNIKLELHSDDIQRIQELYGSSEGTPPPPPPPPTENPDVDPCGNSTAYDTDGDGIDDITELFIIGTNPQDCDTDNDGLPDSEVFYSLNPLVFDTDGDGVGDGDEIANGSNPYIPDQGTGGSGSSSIEGHYVGSDSYGGALDFYVYADGSAEGSLQFIFNGIPYFVALFGGFDIWGQFVMSSYDYYWVYYGGFGTDYASGGFETLGGAVGTWYTQRFGLQDPKNKVVDRESLPNISAYSPAPKYRKEAAHPAHLRVDWRN